MAKHNERALMRIASELEQRGLSVRRTKKGHLLIRDPKTNITTMVGGESLSGRSNRNVHNAKSQLRRVNAHDISTRH